MEIGAQMFTVREFCRDLDGLSETLKKIADIGYRCVQVSGTCAYDAEWLRTQLQKNGLRCVLTHIPADDLQNDTDRVIRNHDLFGCDYVGLGFYPFDDSVERYDAFSETYKPVAEALRQGGKYFMYHNHDQEFRKIAGKTVLQKLAEDFAPRGLGLHARYLLGAGGRRRSSAVSRTALRAGSMHPFEGLCLRPQNGGNRRGEYQF